MDSVFWILVQVKRKWNQLWWWDFIFFVGFFCTAWPSISIYLQRSEKWNFQTQIEWKKEGIDKISNEMLRYGSSVVTLPLVKLFNYILNNSDYLELWNVSLLSTIYKKGDKNNCKNYRGISLSSCLSKLFTNLLRNRLITHLENNNFFSPFQAGFRPDHRTTDQIFAIKTIINKYVYNLKRPVYGCFVDFAKAFDSVSRNSLLYKLTKTNIGGDFFQVN